MSPAPAWKELLYNLTFTRVRMSGHTIKPPTAITPHFLGRRASSKLSYLPLTPRNKMSSDHVSDKLLQMVTLAAAKATKGSGKRRPEDSPALSIVTVISSLLMLGKRLKGLGSLELGLSEFANWSRPALTISWLIMWTTLCYRPYLVACGPVLYILTGLFIPGYAEKFGLDEKIVPFEGEYGNQTADPVLEQEIEKDVEAENDLFESLRQGQASLTKLIDALDKLDAFRNQVAKFTDIQTSSMIFVGLVVALVMTSYGASLVSTPLLFSSIAWIGICSSHPGVKKIKKHLDKMELELFADSHALSDLVAWLFEHRSLFSVDDEPIVCEVEIFELQQQGLTPRLYDCVLHSPYLYTVNSKFRISRQLPPGSRYIEDILPPNKWKFSESGVWSIDKNAEQWVSDREVATQLHVDGEWAYDISGEYRRRRWVRECIRVT